MKRAASTLIALVALAATPAIAEDFSAWWHDGKAELDGYRLKVTRYGQEREGFAVMIFVTEPFSASRAVKVDNHRRNPADVIDVLKLNLVRDFQTGIYDYNTMTSVFVRTEDFDPVKVTFSSAEWCGHVFSEMVYGERIGGYFASYFEGESGAIDIERPQGAVSEDALFIVLRGLRGDYLAPGESTTVPMLTGAYFSRLTHKRPAHEKTVITRSRRTETIEVPAGAFEAARYDVQIADGRDGRFWIESAHPHRIIRWALAPDVSGELTGSARLKYWELNANGHESYLADIGLAQPARP